MNIEEAVRKLRELEGKELQTLARQYGVTIYCNGKVNKGWAGHVLERHLGLSTNSDQSPDFGTWELKTIPLKRLRSGKLAFKETMAITMIEPEHVKNTPFASSHLLSKLRKALIVARLVGAHVDEPSVIYSATTIDLTGTNYDIVNSDYDLVRETLLDQRKGFAALTGSMGVYVQPRTKGSGHGSTSRAFYARPLFLKQFIQLE